MHRSGHIVLTLRSGESFREVPNHLDYLEGACRRANRLDGGALDRALNRWAGGHRSCGVFHARRSLRRVGERHRRYDDVEEKLGFSRTYRVELAEPDRTLDALKALRDTDLVETAVVQSLATVPFVEAQAAVALSAPRRLTRDEALAPFRRVHAPEALEMEPGSAEVKVAVVDTGLALGHPEFQGGLALGYDCVDMGIGRLGEGYKLVGDSRGLDFSPRDECGHGSHVAGVIGARGWRVPRGVGGRCMLMPIRVLAAALSPSGRLSGMGAQTDIDLGMKVCVDLDADVINMSFGTPESSVDPDGPAPHAAVVAYAAHYGCIMIAASGNSGQLQRYFPAALPDVIAVGSVDSQGRRSAFSTYGAHVAICAPGERIVSAGRRDYRISTGTSHAAPFVSGAVALLMSRARRLGRRPSRNEVRRILIDSATPLGPGGFSPETGYGLLNVAAALRRLDSAKPFSA